MLSTAYKDKQGNSCSWKVQSEPYTTSSLHRHPGSFVHEIGARRDRLCFWNWCPNKPSTPLLSDIMCAPIQSSFSSQMSCLFCLSNLAIPFWDFHRTHHSPISYVLYFDKALPETANPFYTLHSAYCWSPDNLQKPLIITVQHLENECFLGCLPRTGSNTQFYHPREKWWLPQSLLCSLLPGGKWILSDSKAAQISMH